ncbi:VanZ family protein [Streptomyces corynorhini]|uniref:VanZ family protein n=1 Tax=Streptomyces corynorhini TaxID=2282652 RepID=A0A370B4I0_9ACTN|nr:VanZ family protein [Streptomyces corynorhini]RDG36718.1 VanZ family protein [Streptomyces corynorhini]
MHLLVVGWLTLRPLDVMWVDAANATPFAGIRASLALGPPAALHRIGEGLVLLAPLGVLLPMVDGRLAVSGWASLARTVTAGALVSLGITLAQTAVPGRVADVDSLLLNTVGVALAHLAVVPAGRARLRRGVRPRTARGARRLRGGAGGGVGRGGSRGRLSRLSHVSRLSRLSRLSREASYAVAREEIPQGATPTIPRVGIAP